MAVGNEPNRCSRTQNEEVIKDLFIGKTLIGERKRRGERYEVVVSNEGKFIYNGKKYNAPSTVSEEITGKSSDGWEFFKVCLDPEEGLRKLSYHRSKFLSANELTLLDLQNFFEKLKGHVRSEVEKYVDGEAKEIKDKAATYITNKVLNNMVGNKPISELQTDKSKTNKPKKVRVAENQYTGAQNKEVIKDLFIGKILIWDRPESGQKYEIKVEGVEKFVDNKTGKVIEAKSLSGVCKALVGGGSYSGWEELEVCLNPKEGLQLLKYHRKKFFSDKNGS